ncbi:glycosyltransferase [Hymenobacter sp. UYCo722]|uniref:glycosyltransferase family 2 protein n=1 Tax=Hymenobacter sp. UYCo722 TaxID=3156335 RepID=UPI00339B103B
MSERRPMVSVCCITYNHEQFLVQTIESVLMQQTGFSVEMVIGEDCSTDDTRRIAQEYAKQYPGRVRVITQDSNLGIMPNLMATMAACQGEYIAFLEGDDYWTDCNKLQIQVDALQANKDCALCFHDAEIFFNAKPEQPVLLFSRQVAAHALPANADQSVTMRFTQLDLARAGWIIPSASMLFRASSLPQPLPAWFAGVYSGDYTLHLLSTRWGPALYLPRLMSRYRMHDQSVSSTMVQSVYHFERRIYEARMFQQHVFDPRNQRYADIYLANQYSGYARYLRGQGQRGKALEYFAKALFLSWHRLPLYFERRLITLRFLLIIRKVS